MLPCMDPSIRGLAHEALQLAQACTSQTVMPKIRMALSRQLLDQILQNAESSADHVRQCAGLEGAMQWALDHANDPGVDTPVVQGGTGGTGGPAGPQAQRGSFSTFSTHSAGIAGILARQERQAAQTDQ